MKKSIIFILLIAIILLPCGVLAKEKEYKTKNFQQTLKEEGIELTSDYRESDDQAIIYMFRGSGCGYCHAFLEYLNSITEEYGKYFKLVSYEVWSDSTNADLLNEVANFTGEEASGVPYIVIGEKVFKGYSETYNEDIKAAIKKQYDSKNSYDVMEEMSKKTDKNTKSNTTIIILFNIISVALATVVILVFNHSENQNIIAEIEDIKKMVEPQKSTKKNS